MRFLVGPGYTSIGADLGPADARISGGAFGFAFALGGAVTQNLILYGELILTMAPDPEVESGAESATANGVSADLFGLGVGVAVYLPANLYLSGSLALSTFGVSDEDGDTIAETDSGPGLSLTLGKEWWVSSNWGLGAALNMFALRTKDKQPAAPGFDTPVWTGLTVSLMFTATFN